MIIKISDLLVHPASLPFLPLESSKPSPEPEEGEARGGSLRPKKIESGAMGKKSWKETESLINESRFSFASSSTDPTPSQFLSFFLSFLSFPFEPRSRPCLEAVPRQNSRAIKSSKLRSNNRFSARFGANLEGGSA